MLACFQLLLLLQSPMGYEGDLDAWATATLWPALDALAPPGTYQQNRTHRSGI